jgi:uncharacterized protein YdeI (YjbR/CyaY-like superfamily)
MGRPVQLMPADVRTMLIERGLTEAYDDRPFYQRNDYLAWIGRAKRADTRTRRIARMLDELDIGGICMGMQHPPSRKE